MNRSRRNDHTGDLRYTPVLEPPQIIERLIYLAIRLHDLQTVNQVVEGVKRRVKHLETITYSTILRLVISFPAIRVARLDSTSLEKTPKIDSEPSAEIAEKSNITITSSGVKVVDKRRLSSPQPHRTPDIESSNSQLAEVVDSYSLNLTSLQFRITGFIARRCTSFCLTDIGMTDLALGRLFWQLPSCRSVLLPGATPGELDELLTLAENTDYGDWRIPVMQYLTRHTTPLQLTDLVSSELERNSVSPLSERRFILVLRAGAHVASSLSNNVAKTLLRVAITHSKANIDPYRPNARALISFNVATRILELRPELEGVILRLLNLQYDQKSTERDNKFHVEMRIAAIAARNRSSDYGSSLIRVGISSGLTLEQLQELSKISDRPLVTEPRIRLATARWPRLAVTGLIVRRLIPWIAAPVIAVFTALLAERFISSDAPPINSLGSSIAILGLLAAVHIFTVQLSASRLPGGISQAAGKPWQLVLSYGSAISLLSLSLFPSAENDLGLALGWASVTSFVLFISSLLVAMFVILRRTDAGRAAKGYVSNVTPKARATGRRLGRLQAESVELSDNLRSLPPVVHSPDPIAGEWSEPLTANGRGFFQPSRRDMRKLLGLPIFRDGMKLRIIPGLGTIVAGGEQLAALVPSRDQHISHDIRKTATKRLRVRSSADTEEIASGAVALTSLALDLARAGDTGTAHVVAEEAVSFVVEHTAAVRASRAKEFTRQWARERARNTRQIGLRDASMTTQAKSRVNDSGIVPVVPAIRDTLRLAVQATLDTETEMFDVPDALISRLLASTGEAEAGVELVTFAILTDTIDSARDARCATEILRKTGVRALELRAWTSFSQILDRLRDIDRHNPTSDALEISSVLAATACRFDPAQARSALDAVLRQIDSYHSSPSLTLARRRHVILLRIGGAALASGALSVAVHATRKAMEQNEANSIIAMSSTENLISLEASRASLRGGYLGDHGMDALSNFGAFVSKLDSNFRLGSS